jgi:hypothetical protein
MRSEGAPSSWRLINRVFELFAGSLGAVDCPGPPSLRRVTGSPAAREKERLDGPIPGADDGIRTRDPHLGNRMAVVHASPPVSVGI